MMKRTKKCAEILKSEASFMYLSLSILSEAGYPHISALMSVVGPNNFIKMIRLFAGSTFKMPTQMEWSTALYTALYLYHQHVEPLSDTEFLKLYDVDSSLRIAIKNRAKQWEKTMKEKNINTDIMLNNNMDF